MSLVYTVLVPTMNRPEELTRCLRATIMQKPPPSAILVVDDGNLDEGALRRDLGDSGRLLKVVRKKQPGLVASLNLGARHCATPWVLVLDDDIYLNSDFMTQIVHTMDAYGRPERLAAVAGYPVLARRNRGWRAKLRVWVERFFLLNGFREGRFLPSSYFTDFECGLEQRRPWRVEHVPGGLALWRTEVFRDLGYDPWFEGYAYGCDMELAYRATRKWHAICVPSARALHDKSAKARVPSTRMGELKIRNQWYFFQKHFSHSPIAWLCYCWATVGHILLLTLAAATASGDRTARFAEVRGMILAVLRPNRREVAS